MPIYIRPVYNNMMQQLCSKCKFPTRTIWVWIGQWRCTVLCRFRKLVPSFWLKMMATTASSHRGGQVQNSWPLLTQYSRVICEDEGCVQALFLCISRSADAYTTSDVCYEWYLSRVLSNQYSKDSAGGVLLHLLLLVRFEVTKHINVISSQGGHSDE